jgi:CxxC motif-containing protein
MTHFSHLLAPLKIGNVVLKNRFGVGQLSAALPAGT